MADDDLIRQLEALRRAAESENIRISNEAARSIAGALYEMADTFAGGLGGILAVSRDRLPDSVVREAELGLAKWYMAKGPTAELLRTLNVEVR